MTPDDVLTNISSSIAMAARWDEPVHEDPATAAVLGTAASVAGMPVPVLLTGESGVGKEVFARYIHDRSSRKDGPFVAINCAAIAETLFESELFGHEKGAFSGATSQHRGVFEQAHGGTLLLDEITEMPLALQSKLLRVLQERVVRRVGGTADVRVDVRIVSTSNRDVAAAVSSGEFRQDLYYRLNVFPLHIPPLRKRRADIRPLAEKYLAHFAEAFERDVRRFDDEAMSKLESYSYPGNVRELVNIVQRAIILCQGATEVGARHITFETTQEVLDAVSEFGASEESTPRVDFVVGETPLTDVRRVIILETLRHFDGNRTATAESLGLSTRTIRNKLRDYRERGEDDE